MNMPDSSNTHVSPQAGNGTDRRRFNRVPIDGTARLFSGTHMWNTQLADISLSGVLVERPENWEGQIGSRYRLDLRLQGGILIGMGVVLARIEEGRGLGFSCFKIDMGSFIQLKRLIELNLGNPQALQHQLAVLGN